MIRIEKATKIYTRGKNEVRALQEVSCSINKGEVFSIIGKSGSGKSTLLNLVGGLDKPTSGHIYFRDRDLMTMNRNELARHRKENVGMIFQSFNLIYNRTALENVMLALAFGGVPGNKRKNRAIELLEQVGLSDRMDHKPDELSGGEAQRVSIARALANHPSAILADEPTGNLDSQTSREIIDLLDRVNRDQGLTLLLVTHDVETAKRISDRMIRLHDGRIIETMDKNQQTVTT